MSRNWTWINEDAERSEEKIERVTPLLDQLAHQWSTLHDLEEQRGFRRRAEVEDGSADYDFEDEADEYRGREMERLRFAQHETQVSAIEEALERHGARIMRPYEHWNEDERLMEYMENRY